MTVSNTSTGFGSNAGTSWEATSPSAAPVRASQGSGSAVIRWLVIGVAVLAVWGAFAMQQNLNGQHLPLGPIGSANCSQAVSNAQSQVPTVVAQAQSNVDAEVAQDPELAPYADAAKQNLADAAPQAEADIAQAGQQLGC